MKPSRALTNSNKHPLTHIPEDKCSVFVRHLHNGNDPYYTARSEYTKGSQWCQYVTVCEIRERNRVPREGALLSVGVSVCSPRDVPNRKLGHQIAVGRAVARFEEAHYVND